MRAAIVALAAGFLAGAPPAAAEECNSVCHLQYWHKVTPTITLLRGRRPGPLLLLCASATHARGLVGGGWHSQAATGPDCARQEP